MFYLHVCPCTTCVPGAFRGQKRVIFLLGSELKTVVSCPVGAGNWTRVLWENNPCSEALSHLFSPDLIFFLMDSGEKATMGALTDARAFQVELEVYWWWEDPQTWTLVSPHLGQHLLSHRQPCPFSLRNERWPCFGTVGNMEKQIKFENKSWTLVNLGILGLSLTRRLGVSLFLVWVWNHDGFLSPWIYDKHKLPFF